MNMSSKSDSHAFGVTSFDIASFDINKLEKYVKILTDNYKLKLNDLDNHPQVNQSYDAISSIIHNNNNNNSSKLINLILAQYRPSQIIPETVGSFLFGCFQQTYGDIPSECSPLCAYNISNDKGLTLEKCDSQIHIQYLDSVPLDGKSRFIKLGVSGSKQGYIFVNLDFLGFTQSEREYFKSEGLSRIQVLVTKDSKHHTVLKMRNVEDVPIIEHKNGFDFVTSEQSMTNSNKTDDQGVDDNAYIYIILAVIIVATITIMYNR